MKPLCLAALILLSGCAMTPDQKTTAKKVAVIGASILVMGAIQSHGGDSHSQTGIAVGPGPSCSQQPNGSCR